jgi:glycosyltransferase involved in cell wall biosynthesis
VHSAPTISVIVPALNEAENLPHVLPRIQGDVLEVILVDGHSTDDTIAVARSLMPSIRVVEQHGRGKGAALRTGFAAARGDIIVMLDADGSTAPEEIPAFVRALVAGADLAKGSRFLEGGGTSDMPAYRKLGNLCFVAMVRLLFGGSATDLCYGYMAFWRRIVPRLALDGTGFEIETMINVRALKAGLRVAEVPSFESRRIHGESNLRTIPDGWRVLTTILRERFTPPDPERPAGVIAVLPAPGPGAAIADTPRSGAAPPYALVPVHVDERAEHGRSDPAQPREAITIS